MASTWSALKVELLETGANAGSWGTLTNANLGDAVLGEAITGQATVDFATDADVTITLTDAATTQAARNLRLNITESSTGIGSVRNLILGSGCQIEKFYLINNTGTGAKTVKNTSGTGITVPAGKATLVYNNGTNVVDAASYFTSLTLGSALPVASGGTGITSFGSGVATFLGTPSSANLAAALTDETGSGSAVFATSPTLVTPNLGTPTTLVLSSATGLPLSSGVTGTLPVANGGTGTATPALVQGSNITITGTWPNQTIAAAAPGTGTVTSVGGTGTVNGISLSGSVTTSGSLTLGGTLSGVSLTSQVTGTLPVANGGTGAATLTANNVLLGNGTSALQVVAPSSSGNVLTSNGSTWTSAAPAGGGFSAMDLFTSSTTFTIPSGKTTLKITVIGGGGGGAKGGTYAFGRGGGAGGGASIKYFTGLTPGNTLTVTIGAGGTAGTVSNNPGGTGGTSSVASGTQSISTIQATGGAGGSGNQDGSVIGGVGSGGTANFTGGTGMGGGFGGNTASGEGGNSFMGGGGYGGSNGSASITGGPGQPYGGGGGGGRGAGSCTGSNGGAGAAGMVMIEY
jgi:hypothetical protein